MLRGAIAEISLSALAHNLRTVRKIVKERPVIAVVKADAYGHGAVEVSKRLLKEGAFCLAVAYTGEAIELRNAGIQSRIIVLFDKGEISDFFDFNLIPVVYNIDVASRLSDEALKRQTKIKVHAKIDTGMGRLGFTGNGILDQLMMLSRMPGLELTGILSHFSEADLADRSYAMLQLDRFNALKKALSENLKIKLQAHFANSAAVISLRDAYLDAVRPGIMIYGHLPKYFNNSSVTVSEKDNIEPDIILIPAMKIKTNLLCIRNLPEGTPISYGRTFITKRRSRIGVLPVGYADGYNRLFSNNANVLVRGKRAPVVGRVCMDITLVDLTEIEDVSEGDEVVLLGDQGNETITAQELADKINSITYEILTSLGRLSKKKYVETH